jgi:ankyrin repeat protein/mRNA-degrading endonuclease RelE of RelBE toxin-antitoxin system
MQFKNIIFTCIIFLSFIQSTRSMQSKQLTPTQRRMQQQLQQRQQQEEAERQAHIQQLQERNQQVNQTIKLSPLHQEHINKDEAFLNACTKGDIDKVLLSLKEGMDVNTKDDAGISALHFAANHGQLEIVELLIKYNAKINAESFKKKTALHFACQGGHLNIVDLLISLGADVNAETSEKEAPLHFAINSGNLDIVKFLVSKGATINTKNINNWTPLHASCQKGDLDIVKLLIENGADVNASTLRKHTPLHVACAAGNEKIVQLLIDNNANLYTEDYQGNMPLDIAITNNHQNIVKTLAENGCTLEVVRNKHAVNLQQILLAPALFNACKEGNYKEVKNLLQKGANIETTEPQVGAQPIHFACFYNHPDIVELLLSKGADVNAKNFAQRTPLYAACDKNNIDIINILIRHKAKIETKDNEGNTPLHIACERNYINSIEILLEKGAHINATNNLGMTPLHIACQNGHFKTVTCLLNRKTNKASIDAQDIQGTTPLDYAAIYSYTPIVEYLLNSGANVNLKRNDGLTALIFSYYQEDPKIRELLIAYGAQEISDEQAKKEEEIFFTDLNQEEPQTTITIPKEEKKETTIELSVNKENKDEEQKPFILEEKTASTETKNIESKKIEAISRKSKSIKQIPVVTPTPKITKKSQIKNAPKIGTSQKGSSMVLSINEYQILRDKNFKWPKFLTKEQKNEISNRIRQLKHWPDTDNLDIKPLKGEKKGTYRMRIGTCRILFFVDEKNYKIFIQEIGPRKNIYRKK